MYLLVTQPPRLHCYVHRSQVVCLCFGQGAHERGLRARCSHLRWGKQLMKCLTRWRRQETCSPQWCARRCHCESRPGFLETEIAHWQRERVDGMAVTQAVVIVESTRSLGSARDGDAMYACWRLVLPTLLICCVGVGQPGTLLSRCLHLCGNVCKAIKKKT